MTTIYMAEGVHTDGTALAYSTANDAKAAAREAYARDNEIHRVLKVELKKDVSTRDLMCALYNNDASVFLGNKELIYTAPARRGRPDKSKSEEQDAEETTTTEAASDEDNEFAEFEQPAAAEPSEDDELI